MVNQSVFSPSRHGRGNLQFLIGGLLLVAILTFIKSQSVPVHPIRTTICFSNHSSSTTPVPRLQLDSTIFHINGHSFAISNYPISVEEYQEFVKATGYRTMRERQRLVPDWKSSTDGPVLWLARRDTEAFCRWFSHRAGVTSPYDSRSNLPLSERNGFRLPTAAELDASSSNTEICCWTCQDLSEWERDRGNSSEYLTIWRRGSKLRHRRTDDIFRQDHEPAGFFIVWNTQ